MAALSTQEITPAGTAPTFDAAAAGGDTATPGNRTFVVFKNANAGATRDVTIAGQGTLATGDDYPDKTYTVPTEGEIWAPLLTVYNDDDGVAQITYADETDVTVAVVRI